MIVGNKTFREMDRPSAHGVSAGEVVLLCCSVLSLIVSCILWSLHKQAWRDEVFTWREVSDPSLWHLYHAIQHGADGGMPMFYTTVWLWAKAFGTGVLTLRLYSCIAMCGALVVTWRTIRRFYGMWATAFGVLAFWGTSGLLLDQNAEGRFYGLFLLAVAMTIDVYARLVVQSEPKRQLLIMSLVSQAVLVLSHVLGIIYGGLILLGLILFDAAKRRVRPRVYLFYSAGWLALLVWVPAIRASMATGRPHGWIEMPKITHLFRSYLFGTFHPWFILLESRLGEATYEVVHHAVQSVMVALLAVIFLLRLRKFAASERTTSDPRSALLLAAYLLLSVPVVLFVLSHLITPVFVPRYLLPSGIGLSIVLADFADALGSDRKVSSRWAWGAMVSFLAISPILSALALPPLASSWRYLDVSRLERSVSPNTAVVADWQDDFAKLMRYAQNPRTQYYFLLDWPSALKGPRTSVPDYHLMSAYRDVGYYSANIQDNEPFLCLHNDFLVLDSHITGPSAEEPSWFDLAVRKRPQFEWKELSSFDSTDVERKLISVHRREQLPFCN
jgi:hypothetical protein